MFELDATCLVERVRLNLRAAESDLLIYVNINLVPMDGGSKSVGVGLCAYPTLQAHHTPQTILDCDSYCDHTRSAMNRSYDRSCEIIRQRLQAFHIARVLTNPMFDARRARFIELEQR